MGPGLREVGPKRPGSLTKRGIPVEGIIVRPAGGRRSHGARSLQKFPCKPTIAFDFRPASTRRRMISPRSNEVTLLLEEMSRGRGHAQEELLPLVYEELRGLARHYMGTERDNHTLQPTALVHEAWIRLSGQREVRWQNRAHFLGVAAQAMRRILVDHARKHRAGKRGGGLRTSLDGSDPAFAPGPQRVDLVDLDRALEELGDLDPRALRVVELRYFAGLGVEETGRVLGVSTATVKRDWRDARAWLRRALAPKSGARDPGPRDPAPGAPGHREVP